MNLKLSKKIASLLILCLLIINYNNLNAQDDININNDEMVEDLNLNLKNFEPAIDKGVTGPLYADMKYQIYLEKGDILNIDYQVNDAMCRFIDNNGNGAHEVNEIKYQNGGSVYNLYDTNNNLVSTKKLKDTCLENEVIEGRWLNFINYLASQSGTYTFEIDSKQFTSYSGYDISMVTQNKISTTHKGVANSYGNVWAKNITTNQGQVGDITTDYYTVDKQGNSYIIKLENYNGVDSGLFVDNLGNGSTEDSNFSNIPDYCLPSYQSGSARLGNIDRKKCNLSSLDNINIFIDNPASWLPEISPNDYDGAEDNSYINPAYKKVQSPKFNVTTNVDQTEFNVLGTIENFQGFADIMFDYDGNQVYDDVYKTNIRNGVIDESFSKNSNVVFNEAKANVRIKILHVGEIHFVFSDVEKSGNITMQNKQTKSYMINYNENKLSSSQSCDTEVDFKGVKAGQVSEDSSSMSYGWDKNSGSSCNKPWDTEGRNSTTYGDFEFVDLWAFDETQTNIIGDSSIDVLRPIIDVEKKNLDLDGQISSFDKLSYQIEIKNIGNADALNTIVKDPLSDPAFLNATISNATATINSNVVATGNIKTGFTIPLIKVGESALVNFEVTFDNINEYDIVKNNVSVDTENDFQPPKTDDDAIAIVKPILVINKQTQGNILNVQNGDKVTYNIIVENKGQGSASNIIIKDSLNSNGFKDSIISEAVAKIDNKQVARGDIKQGLVIPKLESGKKVIVSFDVTFKNVQNLNEVLNVASVDDPNDNGGLITDDNILSVLKPNLTLSKTVNSDVVNSYDDLIYEIKVKNSGNGSAFDVLVKDSLTDLGFENTIIGEAVAKINNNIIVKGNIKTGLIIPEIKAGETVVINFNVKFDNVQNLNVIKNIASVDDPNDLIIPPKQCIDDTNNCDPDSPFVDDVEIKPLAPKLKIKKSNLDDDSAVSNFDKVTYKLVVTNSGDGDAHNVLVKDSLSDIGFNNATVSQAVVKIDELEVAKGDIKTGIVIPLIKANTEAIITFDVTFDVVQNFDKIKNVAMIDDPNDEINISDECLNNTNNCELNNDHASQDIIEALKPKLKIEKSNLDDDSAVSNFDKVTYKLVVSNSGDGDAHNVLVKDSLSDIGFNNATVSQAVVKIDELEVAKGDIKTGIVIPLIKANKDAVITFDVVQNFDKIKNVAMIDDPNDEINISDECLNNTNNCELNNDHASQDIIEALKPELKVLKKTLDKDNSVGNFDKLTYVIEIENYGEGNANDVIVKDSLSNIGFENALISEAIVTINENEVARGNIKDSIVIKTIKAGETAIVTFDVTFEIIQNLEPILNVASIDDPNDEINVSEECQVDTSKCDESSEHVDDELVQTLQPKLVVTKNNLDDDNLIYNNDKVTYQITIENVGRGNANNIFVKDSLSSEAFLNAQVSEAIATNEEWEVARGDIQEGFYLEKINAGHSIDIKFDVVFQEIYMYNEIKNIVMIDDPNDENLVSEQCNNDTSTCDVESNFVDEDNLNTHDAELIINKVSDFSNDFYVENKPINYTITVENISDYDAYDVLIKDTLDDEVFKDATIGEAKVTIDNKTVATGNIKNGITLEKLPSRKTAIVNFSVENLNINESTNKIKNVALVDNIYDDNLIDEQCLNQTSKCELKNKNVDDDLIKIKHENNSKLQNTGLNNIGLIICLVGCFFIKFFKKSITKYYNKNS